jgi:hypothetical protein
MIIEIINEDFFGDNSKSVAGIILKSYKTDILTKESKSTLFRFDFQSNTTYLLSIWSEYGWQKIEKIRVDHNSAPTEMIEQARHIIEEFSKL